MMLAAITNPRASSSTYSNGFDSAASRRVCLSDSCSRTSRKMSFGELPAE